MPVYSDKLLDRARRSEKVNLCESRFGKLGYALLVLSVLAVGGTIGHRLGSLEGDTKVVAALDSR